MRKILSGFPIVFISILCLLIYFETSVPPDFCRSENRYLSDEEFIEIAVTYEINQGNLKLSELEQNANDFILNHPDCCTVTRSIKRSIYSKIFDSKIQYMDEDISVHMSYEANEFSKISKKRINFLKYIDEYLDINSCGKVIKNRRMSLPQLENETQKK